jgi:hypothetical protein
LNTGFSNVAIILIEAKNITTEIVARHIRIDRFDTRVRLARPHLLVSMPNHEGRTEARMDDTHRPDVKI